MKTLRGVYVIEFDNGIKIGMSEDILSRLSFYKSPWNRDIKSIYIAECLAPKKLEYAILKHFRSTYEKDNKHSEFLKNVFLDEVLDVVEKLYHKGFLHRANENKVKFYKKGKGLRKIFPAPEKMNPILNQVKQKDWVVDLIVDKLEKKDPIYK